MAFSGRLTATDFLNIEDALMPLVDQALGSRMERLNSMVDQLAGQRKATARDRYTKQEDASPVPVRRAGLTDDEYIAALETYRDHLTRQRVEYARPNADRDIEHYQKAQAAQSASSAFEDPQIAAYLRAVARQAQ